MSADEAMAADSAAAACGCGVDHDGEGRHAVGVDPGVKERNLKRLRRIEGQIRGLQRMVDEDRYCADILTQISSVHEALRSVGRELMRNHLKHCAANAIRSGEGQAEEMYDELVDMMYKHIR
ncbi:MAG TPA: metal-sensitive transcriptional regulator [Longimicrobium sp.]|nr:metal-sensitive transcriptional regulator [Longimicrobium sp.]